MVPKDNKRDTVANGDEVMIGSGSWENLVWEKKLLLNGSSRVMATDRTIGKTCAFRDAGKQSAGSRYYADISIWLHQAVKGFQDARGGSVPNAHLLGIYHRVCKLLYFKIKPVFVFDGGVPVLKKQTIVRQHELSSEILYRLNNQSKLRDLSKADEIHKQLLDTLLKHTAVSKVITEKIEASMGLPKTRPKQDDLYVLPPSSELDSTLSSSEEESYTDDTTSESSPTKQWDVHTIDMNSVHFKSLPVDVRHEILTDLKETRKQSSWGKLPLLKKASKHSCRLHELPKVSDDFSVFQMQRLLKRQAVQTALEDAEKEMGGKSLSLAELESILKDQGVLTNQHLGNRIASDESTKYLLVKDVKKAIEEARQKEDERKQLSNPIHKVSEDKPCKESEGFEAKHLTPAESGREKSLPKADEEYEEDLKRAIALSLECTATPEPPKEAPPAQFSFLDNFPEADFSCSSSDEDSCPEKESRKLSSAQSYMQEYSGLTPNEISKILANNAKSAAVKPKKPGIKCSQNFQPKLATVTENPPAVANAQKADKCEDSVEIMSTSDSEESDHEPKALDVFVDPTKEFEEDEDLFADIFAAPPTKPDLPDLNNAPLKNAPDIAEKVTKELVVKTVDAPKIIQSVENSAPEASTSNPAKEIDGRSQEAPSQAVESPTIEPPVSVKEKPPSLTEQELKTLKDQLQVDKVNLSNEKATRERMAGNITDQMYQEAQELLELFGVPYVVAPMEAEAQCAFLDAVDLIDGTITDDSDIWLFGGKTVYKNFFNQNKYVMEFKTENIQHHFKLTREQMILLALLVGSDYTVGLQGVGPVTALEILAAFPPSKGKTSHISMGHQDLLSGLKEFKSWFTKGKSAGPGRSALKSKLKNVGFSDNFPSVQVVQAYLDPTVENSEEAFSWGRPNALALLEYARDKFGWTKTKAEDILNPVLKRLEESKHQKSIRDYFKTNFKINSGDTEGKLSKRVKTAINNMGKDPEEVIKQELEEAMRKTTSTRKREPRKTKGRRAPEFSKKAPSGQEGESKERNPDKVNLKKLKPATPSEPEETTQQNQRKSNSKKPNALHLPTTSSSEPKEGPDGDESVTEKINRVRTRRKLMELKAAADLKKPKLAKEKPKDLKEDEEINLLNQVIQASKKKVDEINKELQAKLEKINQQPSEVRIFRHQGAKNITIYILGCSRPFKGTIQCASSCKPPYTNTPKGIHTAEGKGQIHPAEEQVFRKGKRGPGFVPKRNQGKRLPKTEAELSESSDD
ncbi:hypothetical protein YQE_03220, partial [Dendroctonus ponderosae]